MPTSRTRWVTATVIALGIGSIVGAGAAAAAEPAPLVSEHTLVNRDQPSLSETEAAIGDREQLRRYFLQEGFRGLRR